MTTVETIHSDTEKNLGLWTFWELKAKNSQISIFKVVEKVENGQKFSVFFFIEDDCKGRKTFMIHTLQ